MATSTSSSFEQEVPPPQNEPKHCWICFANEDDDYSAQWVTPCKCRGTAKWVHKVCLQRWIDEKQHGNSSIEVACPQCNNSYIIRYPNSGLFVRILDTIDRIICKACPFIAGGILVGSVYWTAVTYGAVTIMQVLGHKEGLNVMEKADPLIMLIGLPTIPVMLMLGRLIRWEDAVLKFWRKHSTKLPLINLIFNQNLNSEYLPRTPAVAYASNSDPVSFTRTICGGLILPTIATIFGKLLFQRINSNFQRSIIGGIAFIGFKGIFKIYYKHQQFLRQAHRQIKNYDNGTSSSSTQTTNTTTQIQQTFNNNIDASTNHSSSFNDNNSASNENNLTRRYRQDSNLAINTNNAHNSSNEGGLVRLNTNDSSSMATTSSTPVDVDDLKESVKVESFNFTKSTVMGAEPLSSSSSTTSLTNVECDATQQPTLF